MKIDKLWNGLKRIANGYYVLEGDLISEETIEINLDDCFVVNGKIRTKKSIVVCCGIKAGEGIEAGDGIKAGWGIEAGRGIEAGDGIEAGYGIEAGCGIEAGDGIEVGDEFGIYAGLCCRVTNKTLRKIIAKERPENIMCGEFEEKSDSEGK